MSDLVGAVEVLVDGIDHPEGVAYDHRTGFLYAGGEAGQIYRIDLDSREVTILGHTPGFVLGLAVDGKGRLVACDSEDGSVWVVDDDRIRPILSQVGDRRLSLPNYPAFGPDGTLYVTDSGSWKTDTGCVIALRPDGTAEILDDTLCRFPNGCAVTPDGAELWVLQSEGEDLHRFDLQAGSPPELVLRLPGTVPDGIAFTEDGGAIISCYRPDRIYRMSPGGNVDVLVEDPQGTLLAAPTNVCFVGEDRSRLITANLGRWHLTSLETGLTGVKPHAPASWAADALWS